MDIFAEFRGKERHKGRAAIVRIGASTNRLFPASIAACTSLSLCIVQPP